MRRAMMLLVAAACGDNLGSSAAPYDSRFDDLAHAHYFGTVSGLGPPPKYQMTALPGIEVCVATSCGTTTSDATFAFTGPSAESSLTITATGYAPYLEGVRGGIAGDRNLSGILLLEPGTLDVTAAAFGETVTSGTVLVEAGRYDQATVQLALAGHTVHYLDASQQPDPSATSLSTGNGAVVFGVEPGEAVLRTTAGHCAPDLSGWPGASPGEIRFPVVAGVLTVVRPMCTGE